MRRPNSETVQAYNFEAAACFFAQAGYTNEIEISSTPPLEWPPPIRSPFELRGGSNLRFWGVACLLRDPAIQTALDARRRTRLRGHL